MERTNVFEKSCCKLYDYIILKAVEKRPIPSSSRIITIFKLHEGGHNWKYLQELNKMAFKKNADNGEFA